MKFLNVYETTIENETYYYAKIGRSFYFKPNYILWIDKQLVEEYDGTKYIKMPMRNCQIVEINRENLVLTKGDKNLFYVEINAKGRGASVIDNVRNGKMYKFDIFHSHLGNTGEDEGALVLSDDEIVEVEWRTIEWKRGKKYEEVGITKFDINGNKQTLENADFEIIRNVMGEE
jgi:Pyruvate/2-oxoacid:ferredoxin oxidoreductase gamma subunit